MQLPSLGQRVSSSMGVVSHTARPSLAGCGHLRDSSVHKRSVALCAPPQRHKPIQRSGQSVKRQKVQTNSLSGGSAQAQVGNKAADSQRLPELPALDGKQSMQMPLQQLVQDKQVNKDAKFVADSYQNKVKFMPYANWLIPGHLMVGRYPYIEPSRCP